MVTASDASESESTTDNKPATHLQPSRPANSKPRDERLKTTPTKAEKPISSQSAAKTKDSQAAAAAAKTKSSAAADAGAARTPSPNKRFQQRGQGDRADLDRSKTSGKDSTKNSKKALNIARSDTATPSMNATAKDSKSHDRVTFKEDKKQSGTVSEGEQGQSKVTKRSPHGGRSNNRSRSRGGNAAGERQPQQHSIVFRSQKAKTVSDKEGETLAHNAETVKSTIAITATDDSCKDASTIPDNSIPDKLEDATLQVVDKTNEVVNIINNKDEDKTLEHTTTTTTSTQDVVAPAATDVDATTDKAAAAAAAVVNVNSDEFRYSDSSDDLSTTSSSDAAAHLPAAAAVATQEANNNNNETQKMAPPLINGHSSTASTDGKLLVAKDEPQTAADTSTDNTADATVAGMCNGDVINGNVVTSHAAKKAAPLVVTNGDNGTDVDNIQLDVNNGNCSGGGSDHVTSEPLPQRAKRALRATNRKPLKCDDVIIDDNAGGGSSAALQNGDISEHRWSHDDD